MRRLHFPADSTLKRSLVASCRDRCYSPLIYTRPHLFVLRIPLPGLFTNAEGIGQILSKVVSGIRMLHPLGSLAASRTMLPDVVRDLFVVFAYPLLMSKRGRRRVQLSGPLHNGFTESDSISALCRRLTHAAF